LCARGALDGSNCSPKSEIFQEQVNMIQLTRLNSKPLMVNSDLIKFVEQSPDTVVTLLTGEKIVVLEKPEEILTRIADFRRSVMNGLTLAPDPSSSYASSSRAAFAQTILTKPSAPLGPEPES
jgi:flagellar protein FlbD